MKFYLASKNAHKILEFKRILSPLGIELITDNDLESPLSDVEETGKTFEENAYLKAISATNVLGIPAIADDSGLCVDFLDGAPGIYSARFAGEPCDNDKNNEKLLFLLENVDDNERTARFVCSIVCTFPDGRFFTSNGVCEGHIARKPSGNNGFGYDPLFISELGSFGEISDDEKDSVSHRGRALKIFAKKIKNYI